MTAWLGTRVCFIDLTWSKRPGRRPLQFSKPGTIIRPLISQIMLRASGDSPTVWPSEVAQSEALVQTAKWSACADERSRSCQDGQTVTDYFWLCFISFWDCYFWGLFGSEDAYFMEKVSFQLSG